MFKITGLDKVQRQLEELSEAAQELDGEITTLHFDPGEPESIDAAIRQMEQAIDAKVSAYQSNDMVMNIVEELKERYRAAILEKAQAARLTAGDE